MRQANVADLKRLGRIRTLPEMKAYEPYPETAQPQNGMTLLEQETCRRFNPNVIYKFFEEEAQNAN